MTVEQLQSYHTLSLLHKVIRTGEPEALAGMFCTNASVRQRNTRQDNLLHIPRSRTECGKRRFCVRAPSLYNALPLDLRERPVRSFNAHLKRFLRDADD